jgi:2-polyprenyl-3-methyl-5-hydroxy-6-metoxy-1,4-benzoquinol methylase
MAFSVQETKCCRLCGSEKLVTVLSLGKQFVVDFVTEPAPDSERIVPLELVRCGDCSLVQLRHSVDADSLYKHFWYKSDCNEQMSAALKEIADTAQDAATVKQGDRVLDIGANNGVLLGWYPAAVKTVGVDPCAGMIMEGLAHQRMEIGLAGYFSEKLVAGYGPFKVITAISMFYDVPEPVDFLKQCKHVMASDGLLIIQMNYLVEMMKNFAVDNICHEHLMYYSLTTMKRAADMAELEVAGAEVNDVNGGSVRVYLTHKNFGLHGLSSQRQMDLFMTAMNLLHREMQMELDSDGPYNAFSLGVRCRVKALRQYLVREAEKGEKIYVYGASTRGTVLLQMLDLPEGVIQGVAERNVAKYNLHMVGNPWPRIYSEAHCRKLATQFLILPWHYEASIVEREAEFLAHGGKLIFPLPSPRVIKQGGKISYLQMESESMRVNAN